MTRLLPGRRPATAGFSLLELLVSALIFSIIMLAFTSLFQTSITSWMAIMARIERTQSVYGGIAVIGMRIRSTLPLYSQHSNMAFKGRTNSTLTNSRMGELEFHSVGYVGREGNPENEGVLGYRPGSDLMRTSYWLRRDTASDSRIQQGRTTNLPGGATGVVPPISGGVTGSNDELVLRVLSLSFEYLDSNGAWQTTWDQGSGGLLPRLIRITMVNGRRNQTPVTGVFIVRPMATGNAITL
jgi:prepilin-type N-terminal cleavage/methylation domain-containing protein